jgi:hypothetical protein
MRGPGRRGQGAEEDAPERIRQIREERPDDGDTGIGGAGPMQLRMNFGTRHYVPGVFSGVQCAPPSIVRWIAPRMVA